MAFALQIPDPVAWHDSAEGDPDEFAVQLSSGQVVFTAGFDDQEALWDLIRKGFTIYAAFTPRQDSSSWKEIFIPAAHVVAIIDLRSGD